MKSLEESLDIAVHLNLKDFVPNQHAKGHTPVLMSSKKFFGEDTPIARPDSPEKPDLEYIYESDDTCDSYSIEYLPVLAERVMSESEESTYWDYDEACPDLLSDGESDEINGRVDIVDKFARSDLLPEDMQNLGMGYLAGYPAPTADEESMRSYAKTMEKVDRYYSKANARNANFKKPRKPKKPKKTQNIN